MAELVLGGELLTRGLEAARDVFRRVGPAADEPGLERLLARGRDEDLGRLGHRLADLARALDLDLEQHRGVAGASPLELVAEGSVAPAGVAGVLDEVAAVHARLELVVGEEVVVDAVLLPRPGSARRRRNGELELGHALPE